MTYDAIVLGLGGMGSAAAHELARRDRRVLGLEQYGFAHSRGSSHGRTRIIRQAYYEHPSYVPLVQRAYERWFDLEQFLGRHLLTHCECVTIGPAAGELIAGVRASAEEHSLQIDELSPRRLRFKYPQFAVPENYDAIIEKTAGFLNVEACVRAHLDAAEQCGAELHSDEPVRSWSATPTGVEVVTDRGTYSAAKLIITAGAWATQLLRNIGVPLTVMRQTQLWFAPHRPAAFRRDRFPIFLLDSPEGAFYGLPMLDPSGVKLARHYGAPELPSPDGVNWDVTPEDEAPVRAFAETYLPGQLGPLTRGEPCLYTLTPDRHFVIDVHPEFENVCFAAGFSGHGFKFASAVGEVLADLCETGRTEHDIALFSCARFGEPRA